MLNLTNEIQNKRNELLELYPLLKDLLIESDHIGCDADIWIVDTDTTRISFSSESVSAEQYGTVVGGYLRGIPFDTGSLFASIQALEMARIAAICQIIQTSNSNG